jgi:hypothetical protein
MTRMTRMACSAPRMGSGVTSLSSASVISVKSVVKIFTACLLVLLTTAPWAAAVDVEFDVQPRVLQLGESATCRITIHGAGNAPAPSLPPIPGFQVQSAGVEQNFSFGTGGQGLSITHNFRLVPQQAGRFTIGPFKYQAGGQEFDLPAVSVEVTAGGAPGQPQATKWSDLLFSRLTSERTDVFTQESFDITLAIYSSRLNLDRNIGLDDLESTGLALQPFGELPVTREAISNQVFEVRRFRTRATALTAGTFKLAPTVRVAVLVQGQRRPRSIFDEMMFFGNVEAQQVQMSVAPLEITVHPLPAEGRPANFSGAVGRFTFDASLKPAEVNEGDPVTITLQIRGDGNIESVSAPALALGDAFKTYDARLVNSDRDAARGIGQKIFEQVVIPRTSASTNLPAIDFSFFDPRSRRYETITRGPFALTVRAGTSAGPVVVQGKGGEIANLPQVVGSDIAYAKPAPSSWVEAGAIRWYAQPPFLATQIVPVAVLAAVFLFMRRRDELDRNVSLARRHQAPRAARAAIAKARSALTGENTKEFFEALWEATSSYFGNRLNLPPGKVDKATVLGALSRGGLDTATRTELEAIFDRCDQVRFGQEARPDRPELERLLERLSASLRSCERVKL